MSRLLSSPLRKRTEQALRYTKITLTSHLALTALIDYAAQRPGLDIRNYGSWQSYRDEVTQITRQWHTICKLLPAISFYAVTDEQIIDASRWTYSGRMTWIGSEWEYCTGQYWPTEYRSAVLAILRAVLPQK